MSFLRAIAAILIVASPVFARARASSYCTQGGQVAITNTIPSATKIQQSYPQCSIQVFYSGGAQGYVTTSANIVTFSSGIPFNANSGWPGLTITLTISGTPTPFTIQSVTSAFVLVLTASAGTNATPIAYSMPATAPAAIFSNNTGTALANPFVSSTTGYWGFFADNGTYDISASGGGIPAPITWSAVSVIDPFSLPLFISSRTYIKQGLTFYQACASAAAQGLTLVIDQTWYAIPTSGTCAATVQGGGGLIQPASGQTVTISGFDCPQTAQCFDGSLGGSFIFPARSTVTPNNFGAQANGAGATGTEYSTKWGHAINALDNSGGGSLFIPYAPLCYWAHGIQLYSNITIYSDSRSTCIQIPANGWTTQGQILTTGNSGTGGAAVSNIHIDNLTLDGNKANQTGVPPDQDGGFGIFLAGCSNCSVTNSIIKNNITDGITLDGSGSTTTTVTANAIEAACTVTGAVYIGNVATYTCSATHGMASNQYVTVTGMNPSGYNQTASQCVALTTTAFGCHAASDPGAFVSGGTATWSELQYISGEPISNMQQTALLTGGFTGGCVVAGVNQANNSLSCATDQGTHLGVIYTIPVVATGVGDNVEIANNLITGNERNGISLLCGTHTRVHDNHISYTGGILSGPWSAIDIEPDKYGCKFEGTVFVNEEWDHNQGNGFSGQPYMTYDPNFSPVFQNINAHNNGYGSGGVPQAAGILIGGPFGPNSTLVISGVFQNNGSSTSNGGAGVTFGWENSNQVVFPWIVTGGSWNGILSTSIKGSSQILGGSLSATGNDIGYGTFAGYEAIPFAINGAALVGAGASSSLNALAFSFYGIPSQSQAFAPGGICSWDVMSPRTGQLNCAAYITLLDYATSPGILISDSGATVTGKMQAVTSVGVGFTNQGTLPAWIGSHNAVVGAVGSISINQYGLSLQPADTFANVTSGSTCGNLTQGYEANIIDGSTATWGATVTGGGSNKVKMRCNGTNWTVEGS